MKAGTTEKMKFKKLMRRLKLKVWQCAGILETLWAFTAGNTPLGDIGRFSNEEIAIGIDWEDDADELIQALVECRWLDASEQHRLVIHDWHEHAPNYLKGNIKQAGQQFASILRPAAEEEPIIPGDSLSPALGDSPKDDTEGSPKDTPSDHTTKSSQVKSSQSKPSQSKSNAREAESLLVDEPEFPRVANLPEKQDPRAPYPGNLDVPEFHKEWEVYLKHWKSEHNERPLALDKQLRKLQALSGHGLTTAMAAICDSNTQGYTGIFPEKFTNAKQSNGKQQRRSERITS